VRNFLLNSPYFPSPVLPVEKDSNKPIAIHFFSWCILHFYLSYFLIFLFLPTVSHKSPNTVNTNILRRRSPFVPFALKNETGIKLYFTTLVSSADGVSRSGEVISHAIADPTWQSVNPGEVTDFTFGKTLNKKRHHDSHKLNLHQIHVHVEGWHVVGPISVDKVGVFFRHAKSEYGNEYSILPRARIVFAVTLEGAAQKLITVRSALKLYNKLDNPVLLKMEHLFGHLNIRDWPDPKSEIVNSTQVYSVPLSHVHAFLYVKPLQSINFEETLGGNSGSSSVAADNTSMQKFDGSEYWNKYENFESSRSSFRINNNYQFTDKSIHWKEMIDHSEGQQELRTCRGNRDKSYRLVVAIRKDGYPSKDGHTIPGHTLTLFPPLRLHNLLPCDLLYKVPGTGTKGRISSAKTATLNEIDLEQPTELNVTLDSYPVAGQIHIPQGEFFNTFHVFNLSEYLSTLSVFFHFLCIFIFGKREFL
jgi:vacuolar protein sorting-associated protein 13D